MYLINFKFGIIPQELAELFRYKDKTSNGCQERIQRLLRKAHAEHYL